MASSLYSNPSLTAASFTHQFHSVLSSILEKHAPLKTICCRSNPRQPFISDEILEQKSKRSRPESIFRRDKKNPPEQHNPEIKVNYITQCKSVDKMVTTAKGSYFRNMIS